MGILMELVLEHMWGVGIRPMPRKSLTFKGCIRDKNAYENRRRDPERDLQSWFRPAKPETRNPKPTLKT